MEGGGSAAVERFGDKPAYGRVPETHFRRRDSIEDSLTRAPTVVEHKRMKFLARPDERITPYPKPHRNKDGHYPTAPKGTYFEHPAFDFDYQNRDTQNKPSPGHTRALTGPNKDLYGVSYHPKNSMSNYVRADEGYAPAGLSDQAKSKLQPRQLDWHCFEGTAEEGFKPPRRVPTLEAAPADPRRQARMMPGEDALESWLNAPRAPRLPRPAPRWPSPPPPARR